MCSDLRREAIMTPKQNSKPRRPTGPKPPAANFSRELRDTEYAEVLRESERISDDAVIVETIKL